MENAKQEKGEEKKKGFWQKFMNFLMYGGFIVVLVVIVAIVVIVQMLMKWSSPSVSQIEFLSNTQWTISFRLSLEGEGKGGGEFPEGSSRNLTPCMACIVKQKSSNDGGYQGGFFSFKKYERRIYGREKGRKSSGEYRNRKQAGQNFQKASRNRFLLGDDSSDLQDGDPSVRMIVLF